MARRHYGTGSLRQVGQSWIGSWYGPDDRRVKRQVGAVRTPGERDGLTKAQAETSSRGCARPSRSLRNRPSRHDGRGGAELSQALELRGRKKSHRLTVASDLRNHIVPFFAGKDLAKISRAKSSATSRQAQDPRDQDDPQPPQHDPLDLRDRPAARLVPAQPGQARRAPGDQEDRDADPVPRPARA